MKLLPSYPIEIYVDESGYICLKTEGDMCNPEDQLILISPPQFDVLLKQSAVLMKIALQRWHDEMVKEGK